MLGRLRRFIRRLQASEKYQLSYLFEQLDPSRPLFQRVEMAAALIEWLRPEGKVSLAARVKFVLQWLERNPEMRRRSAQALRSILRETSAKNLYLNVGLASQPAFGKEFRTRLLKVFVPEYLDPSDLAGVQARIFYEDEDPGQIAALPEALIDEVIDWLRDGLSAEEELIPGWRTEVIECSRILTARSLAITLREDFRRRAPERRFDDNPFVRMSHLYDLLSHEENRPGLYEGIRSEIAAGRKLLNDVRKHLEQTGVSVDLMYQLDRIRGDLTRLNRLLGLLERDHRGEKMTGAGFAFWIELLQGHQGDSDFGAIFRKHMGLLSKKIVERAGVSGEHYITQTPGEYFTMMGLAAGGGLITAGTAYLKYFPDHMDTSLFGEFVFHATNFSLSFLLMHWLGFKLATKQPSMTAAALAARLREEGSGAEDDSFVDELARISRSQFAAVVGNLMAVVPAALVLDLIHRSMTGFPFFSFGKADDFVEHLNPLFSDLIPYAALTGVLLWLSSLIAGWVENASVYHRIPDILRSHPALRWILGEKRVAHLAETYLQNVSGVAGAIALGVLLALIPTLGSFFGLPLGVYHVTLTTGAATYAFASMDGLRIPLSVFATVGVSIFIIGFLNFTVSFALALALAVRARDLPPNRVASIFRRAGRRLLSRPLEFFFPMRPPPPAKGA